MEVVRATNKKLSNKTLVENLEWKPGVENLSTYKQGHSYPIYQNNYFRMVRDFIKITI